jgi:hypothetical protein
MWDWKIRRSLVNTGAPWPGLDEAERRVRQIQTKLHQWATTMLIVGSHSPAA